MKKITIAVFLFTCIPYLLFGTEYQKLDPDKLYSSSLHRELKAGIDNYIITHSLEPFMKRSSTQFDIREVFEDPETGVYYVFGELRQANRSLFALFSVETGWVLNNTKLVHLSSNLFLTPCDFEYLLSIISSILDFDLSQFLVLVNDAGQDEEGLCNWLIWTGYNLIEVNTEMPLNPDESLKIIVEIKVVS